MYSSIRLLYNKAVDLLRRWLYCATHIVAHCHTDDYDIGVPPPLIERDYFCISLYIIFLGNQDKYTYVLFYTGYCKRKGTFLVLILLKDELQYGAHVY